MNHGGRVTANPRPDTIAVFGAGVMGCGITALALGRGVDVTLVDASDDVLRAAEAEIARQLVPRPSERAAAHR
ncbi:3-hydroxyacyl-CoA dehydrogenase NAD-binding domain-containing protein [Streptomyces sp. OE57]|uniref:3-hydroxyacyl-CoA dehydrogenase NAD-binding domain-containing protein n=1 Tax=Streptomyces lacaronensis TaxID=3379885 RepID=UPI0039B77F19